MAIKEAKFIWMDGEMVPWRDAKIHVLSHVVHYGSGVFEGIRSYEADRGPEIFRLTDHLKRLYNSAKIYRMEIPYSLEELKEATKELIKRNELKSAYIRPIVFRGYGTISPTGKGSPVQVAIIAFEFGRYLGEEEFKKGVDVMISSWRKFAPDTIPAMAKASGNYLNSSLVGLEAAEYGFKEGILLDNFGFLSEGSGENIFLVKDGVLFTPPVSASILVGITRDSIVKIARDLGFEVRFEFIPREMVYIADELFFVGTAAEVTPIRSVDRIPIGKGVAGEITLKIQRRFLDIVEGREEDRYGWLEYVY
ncbi:MAG: branched-chain amino acid transaminase [Caldisericia bacterium]|nr:branched-chain amino acid transaminase [Caldisericia bacterium]